MAEATTLLPRDVGGNPSIGRPEPGPGLSNKIQATGGYMEIRANRGDFVRKAEGSLQRGTEISLPLDARAAITDRLNARRDVAIDLHKDQKRLGYYDRFLISDRGREIIQKMGSNTSLSPGELAVAWAVIHQELADKTQLVARDSAMESVRIERTEEQSAGRTRRLLRRIPVVGRLVRDLPPEVVAEIVQQEVSILGASDAPQVTNDYLEKIHYADWDEAQIVNDLTDLNGLRLALDAQLGKTATSWWKTSDFARGSGMTLEDATVDQLRSLLAENHRGRSITELESADPVAAAQVRYEARSRALMHYADWEAKALLREEKPRGDITAVDAHIAELRRVPAPEDLDTLVETRDTAVTKSEEAQHAYDDLISQERALEQRDRQAMRAFTLADRELTLRRTRLEDGMQHARDMITNIRDHFAPPATLSDSEKAAHIAGQTARLENAQNLLRQYEEQLAELERRKIEAETDRDEIVIERTDLATNIATAQAELTTATADRTAAESAFEAAQNGRISPEAELTATGLERWKIVAESGNYLKIIDAVFRQRYGDRFARARLADLTVTADGNVTGAERIREHVFSLTDTAWFTKPENRALARELLSDEAIAKAIIEVFRVDDVQELFELHIARSDLAQREVRLQVERTRQTPDQNMIGLLEQEIALGAEDIRALQGTLLKKTLPLLKNAPQFYVGDVLRFAIQEGIRSAAEGNPFLNVPREYEKQQPELRITPETILRENIGEARIFMHQEGTEEEPLMEPHVQWTGEVGNLNPAADVFEGLTISPATRLRLQTEIRFTSDGIALEVSVETNEKLMSCLPAQAPADLPSAIRGYFYDENGNLRTRDSFAEDQTRPQWIRLAGRGTDRDAFDGTTNDMQNILLDVNSEISPEIAGKVSIATANEVFRMPPEKRRTIVRGFQPLNINVVDSTGTPITANISFDNDGQFWIETPGGRVQLESFFEAAERAYAQHPNEVRQMVSAIQSRIGQEILETQAHR